MTRSAPNSCSSPCVARKTPPKRPTSSPSTTTSGSRRISTRSASFTAWITFITGIGPSRVRVARVCDPRVRRDRLAQLLELLPLLPERLGVDLLEQALHRRLRRVRLRLYDRPLDLGAHLVAEPRVLRLVERPAGREVAPRPEDRVLLLPRLHQLRRPVHARVVGGGVAIHPVGDALDERRPLPRRGPRPRAPDHRVHREEIVPVHPLAPHPVGDRLLRDRLRARLPLARDADRPAVVPTEEDDR